eukprot:SAG22_NODE_1058_length_5769_cov_6.433510_4_plen_55_part_00
MPAPDAAFLVRIFLEAVGAGARWVFILLFGVCAYWFMFFKRQSSVYQVRQRSSL